MLNFKYQVYKLKVYEIIYIFNMDHVFRLEVVHMEVVSVLAPLLRCLSRSIKAEPN